MFANGRIRLWYFDKEGNSFGILVTWSHRAGGRHWRVNSIYDNNESSSVFAQMSTENLEVSTKKLFLLNLNGGARVGQWWEHKIPASAPYMGWVCFWFSPILLRKLFPRVLQFLLFQHFQIPIRPRTHGHVSTRELINFPIYTWHTYPDGSSSNAKWMGLCPVLLSNRVLYETAFTVTAGKTCYYTERSLQTRLFERHILQAKTLLFLLSNSLTCSFLLRTPLRVNNST